MSKSIHIQVGGRSTELVRLPSLKTKDQLPREAVQMAREAIERGRTVEIPALRQQDAGSVVALIGVVLSVFGIIALTQSTGVSVLIFMASALMVAGGLRARPSVSTGRLLGRRVAGNGRISTALWRQALQEVDNGSRTEDELPAIHHALIEVADAEDAVNRLITRNKYQLDQTKADVARSELATRVAEARNLMGLTAIEQGPDSAPHLSNRWVESAGLSTPEPVNPEDLR